VAGTVSIVGLRGAATLEMKKDKINKPFGPAVLDVLARASRPSNGRNFFSTLTKLDLNGNAHSSLWDDGVIRFD